MRKDSVGIRCCSVFSKVELLMVNHQMQAPRHYLRQRDRSPVTYRLLALENQTDSNSSLLSHLVRFIALFAGHLCFRFVRSLTVGIVDEKTFQP